MNAETNPHFGALRNAGSTVSLACRFVPNERDRLLRTAGIGPAVVRRLEEVGISSLDRLRSYGVDEVVRRVCHHVGSGSWGNRRRALARALADVQMNPLQSL